MWKMIFAIAACLTTVPGSVWAKNLPTKKGDTTLALAEKVQFSEQWRRLTDYLVKNEKKWEDAVDNLTGILDRPQIFYLKLEPRLAYLSAEEAAVDYLAMYVVANPVKNPDLKIVETKTPRSENGVDIRRLMKHYRDTSIEKRADEAGLANFDRKSFAEARRLIGDYLRDPEQKPEDLHQSLLKVSVQNVQASARKSERDARDFTFELNRQVRLGVIYNVTN